MYFTDQVDRKMSIADSIDGPPFECGQFFFLPATELFQPTRSTKLSLLCQAVGKEF